MLQIRSECAGSCSSLCYDVRMRLSVLVRVQRQNILLLSYLNLTSTHMGVSMPLSDNASFRRYQVYRR